MVKIQPRLTERNSRPYQHAYQRIYRSKWRLVCNGDDYGYYDRYKRRCEFSFVFGLQQLAVVSSQEES